MSTEERDATEGRLRRERREAKLALAAIEAKLTAAARNLTNAGAAITSGLSQDGYHQDRALIAIRDLPEKGDLGPLLAELATARRTLLDIERQLEPFGPQ